VWDASFITLCHMAVGYSNHWLQQSLSEADMCNDENPTASRSNRHLAIKVTGVWKVYIFGALGKNSLMWDYLSRKSRSSMSTTSIPRRSPKMPPMASHNITKMN